VKPQRNEACPCGSGKKFKLCCGRGSPLSRARPASVDGPSAVETNQLIAMIKSNRFAEAEIAARGMVDRFPTVGFGWKCLSVARVMQDKNALDALRTAAALLPNDAEAHFNLGYALRKWGRPNEALGSYYKGLNLNRDNAEALTVVGELLVEQGHYSEARQSFQRAAEINPDLAAVWVGLANCWVFDRDIAWLDNAQRLLQGSLQLQEAIDLRFAIGRYHDHHGNFEQAFASFKAANELTQSHGLVFDPTQITAQVDQIINTFDEAWIVSQSAVGNDSNLPVFLVGMPVSGTTLAGQLLAVHPRVIDAGALNYWLGRSAENSAQLAPDYLQWLARLASGADRVIDRMAANYMMIGMIHAALPNAHIIHIDRDPMDTCLGIYSNNFAATYAYSADLEDLAHQYQEYLRLMRHWRSVLPAGVLLDLSYASLVQDPQSASRAMVEFIGLSSEGQPATIDRDQTGEAIAIRSLGASRNYERFLGPLRNLESLQAR